MRTRASYSARLALLSSIACFSLLVAPGTALCASNPVLFAERDGVEEESARRELQLTHLTLDVTIEGSIAETTLTATFAGVAHEVLEGHFSLALPDGAIVNGYALDIDEAMVEGTLISRPKAREVYAAKVRAGIDPGLAEVSSANVFATKVYPIQSAAGRTIRVKFVTPVHRALTLPLTSDAPVGTVDIKLRARDVATPPTIQLPQGLAATWRRSRGGYVASVTAHHFQASGALQIAATTPRRDVLLSTDGAGHAFFQIHDMRPEVEQRTPRPNRVRVYWDHSTSRRDDDLAREQELLERYLTSVGMPSVDFVSFNSSGARISRLDSLDSLRTALAALTYRGGTSFAVLDALRVPNADVCLLFSDGSATIDRRDTFAPNCIVKAITSANDADRGYLAQLTRASGGVVISLGRESNDSAHRRLIEDAPIIVSASTAEGRPLSFCVIENSEKGWFVIGEAPRSGEIVLHLKTARGRAWEQRYDAKLRHDRFDGIAALWAADQVARLAVAEVRQDEIERLSRRYSVASSTLAFVVLDSPQDYADLDVVPPKSYPQESWAEYRQAKIERDAESLEERVAHLESLHRAWQEQKDWWAREFDPRARPRRPSALGQSSRARDAVHESGIGIGLDEVIVTARVREESIQDSPIAIDVWTTDRPYLHELDATPPSGMNELLAEQERAHGNWPAYYLDTAEWLFRHDETTEASEMLLSALELPLSNDETKAVVAERLLRYGYYDRAIGLYEQTARLASHRPQPKMQLALALAKRAAIRTQTAKRDLRRAISLLNEVATTPWDDEYGGIGLIALMEANALIPRFNRMGGTRVALAPELIALLDLDIRVVIDWNTAATDLDLWVDEPNGERAIYSNRHTAIGGRLSQDMTAGYGPEEYLLRRAAPGEYRVNIDVYSSDALNPNGATIVTARLIHDFGRQDEREESVDIELLPNETGERLVGRILVGGAE